jgi:hypothetical protein
MRDWGETPALWASVVVASAIALAGQAAQTQPLKQAPPPKLKPPQAAPEPPRSAGDRQSPGTVARASVPEPELPPQTVLMPGLYLFQTRTRDGSCNDAPRTGYVTSAVATLDGVPGARTMTMQLLNSKYWPTWTLTIAADGSISGTANMGGAKDDANGVSKFEIKAKKERFQGVGSRNYPSTQDGKQVRCTLNYDALLKPLD